MKIKPALVSLEYRGIKLGSPR